MATEVAKYRTSTGNVIIDVIIGDANPGQISASVTDPKAHTTTPLGAGPALKAIDLGVGPGLIGKVLVVSAEVQAAQPATLWTSATLALSGGTEDDHLPLSEKAAQANANVNFLFVVSFT